MAPDPTSGERFEVLIAGGGVAGIEAALALRDLAADRVNLKLLAPNSEFVYRPMTVREPFSFGQAERYPLREAVDHVGGELIEDRFKAVDPSARTVRTESGAELRYDALILGLGAHIRPRYEHAVTIDDRRLDELLHGLIQDVEEGYVKRLAFVVPPRMGWPLPVYELALMTAGRADDMNISIEISIVTPEDAPLAVFGDGVCDAVTRLLAENRIDAITSGYAEIPSGGVIEISPGERRLEVDRVVALPELAGPSIPGLPEASDGFIPVDPHCQVRGVERVYAAGDVIEFPIKHGGLASQQADAAAEAIAALAGAAIDPKPFHPEIRGMLLTGARPLYMHAHITGGHGFHSEVSEQPLWSPPGKIAAKYLAPYLEGHEGSVLR